MTITRFSLTGSYAAFAGSGCDANQPSLASVLNLKMSLERVAQIELDLLNDAPLVVALNGMTEVHALVVQSSSKIRVRLTSADGTDQAVPVDGLLVLASRSVPLTAVELTRVAGTATSVLLFLGQRAD